MRQPKFLGGMPTSLRALESMGHPPVRKDRAWYAEKTRAAGPQNPRRDKTHLYHCHYCGNRATFSETSAHLYGGKEFGAVWECRGCRAYVGVHPDGSPKGTVATERLRVWRKRAHSAFDHIWRDGHLTRDEAYLKLAEFLGIPREDCHIGEFGPRRCQAAIAFACAFLQKATLTTDTKTGIPTT